MATNCKQQRQQLAHMRQINSFLTEQTRCHAFSSFSLSPLRWRQEKNVPLIAGVDWMLKNWTEKSGEKSEIETLDCERFHVNKDVNLFGNLRTEETNEEMTTTFWSRLSSSIASHASEKCSHEANWKRLTILSLEKEHQTKRNSFCADDGKYQCHE